MSRILLALLIISVALSGCISDHRIEDARVAMDTDVTITAVHHDVPEAELAIERAFAEIYRIEDLMTYTGDKGEVARLNKNGHLRNASPDLLYVVTKSVECSELSNGSFDITVLPVVNLWKEKIRAGSPPTDDEINETLKLVNYKNISINLDIEKIISLVKERATFINDLWEQGRFFFVAPENYDEKAAKKAFKEDTAQVLLKVVELMLGVEDFSASTISEQIKGWINSQEMGFGKVMMPLRLSLVGEMKGPDVFEIASVLGKDEAISRIKKAVESIR